MADNTYNITLPDGTTIPVPAWARESTLNVLVEQLKIGTNLNNALVSEIKNLNIDTSDIEAAIKQMFDNLEQAKREETSEEAKSRLEFAKGIAKKTNDLVDTFSDTSAPLSSMSKTAERFAGFLGKSAGGMFKDNEMLSMMSQETKDTLGSLANITGDAIFGYLGFVAGQIENFAKAQANMINAGAIFYDSATTFESLRTAANNTGLTYEQLSTIASQYGTTLQVLGQGVSGGVSGFLEQFGSLKDVSDQFGDFGMANEQLANAFIEYIDVARLTGRVNNETVTATGQLQGGFGTLIMETTALAALSGKTRDQLLAEQNAVLRSTQVSAALTRLRDAGFDEEADKMEMFMRDLAVAADYLPSGTADMIATAFSTAYSQAAVSGDMSGVNLTAALRAADPSGTISAILNQSDIDLMGQAQAIMEGDGSISEVRDFFLNQVASLNENLPNVAMNTGDALGEYAAAIKEFGNLSVKANQDFQTLIGTSGAEREQRIRDLQSDLGEAGTATVAINDLTVAFLKAQNLLTPSLDTASSMAAALAGSMESLASLFDKRMQRELEPDEIGSAPERERFDTSIETMQENDDSFDPTDGSIPSIDPMTGERYATIRAFDQEMFDRFSSYVNPQTGQAGEGVKTEYDPIYETELYVLTNPSMPYSTPTIMLPEGYRAPIQRRDGGTVSPGTDRGYIVGEAGPEYFEPGQSGAVTSFANLSKMMEERTSVLVDSADAFESLTQNIPNLMLGLQDTVESAVNEQAIPKEIMDLLQTNMPQPQQQEQTPLTEGSTTESPVIEAPEIQNNVTVGAITVEQIQSIMDQAVQQTQQESPLVGMIEKVENSIQEVVEAKKSYADVIRRLNVEVKHYNRLNQQGRTTR